VVSEEKRKEKNGEDLNLTLLFAKISAIFLLESQIKVFLKKNFKLIFCGFE